MRRAPLLLALGTIAITLGAPPALGDEPPPCPPACKKAAPLPVEQAVEPPPAPLPVEEPAAPPPAPLKVVAPSTEREPAAVVQESPPLGRLQTPVVEEHPQREEPPARRPWKSDGAGPRLTFGRVRTEFINDGFYGRFETEYFEVEDYVITGALLGVEGWGTDGASAGGFSIPISVFAGLRGGPFASRKAPVLFATVGVGIDAVIYDRVGRADGFGLLTPFAVGTAGIEAVPGIRLLADFRAAYRWHWTMQSQAQYQLGLTVGLNSYLWDGF